MTQGLYKHTRTIRIFSAECRRQISAVSVSRDRDGVYVVQGVGAGALVGGVDVQDADNLWWLSL